jgi:signal transduction histidine kinase
MLGLATGIALMALEAQVGLPQAVPLMVLPGAVALFAVHIAHRRRQRVFDAVAIASLVLLAGFGLLVSSGETTLNWSLFWLTPTVLGLLIGSAGDALAIITRLSSLPGGGQRRLAFAAVPLAAESQLQGADEERSRLAMELHNEVLPRVETSLRNLRGSGSVDDAATTLETLATDLRDSMEQRQTVLLETAGVAAALRHQFEARPGPHVTFFVRGASFRPKSRVELAAFRIGQAAIDNALRHSGADQIDVTITSARDLFDMTIEDDGVGLDVDAEDNARRRGRIGLAQMRVRAESVGANLDLRSRPGGGTSVVFHWSA